MDHVVEGPTSRTLPVKEEPRAPIAIVGIGCRYPGAQGPDGFWRLLDEGRDEIREVPSDRFDLAAFHDARPRTPGKLLSRSGGFLEDVLDFDAEYFRISPREASRLDPQHRLLLEVCAEALDDASLGPDALSQMMGGVYMGCWASDWECHEYVDRAHTDIYSMAGSGRCLLSGRVSFAFDLRGPSLTVDTGCSASLIAAHLACQSLWMGECAFALAGGVNLIFDPKQGITFSQADMLSADGLCKAFDSRADGFTRSDGCGVVVLMPLARAEQLGLRVYATIAGSGASNDGCSNGLLTTPSEAGQEEAIRAAYRAAGWTPDAVQYVEAHGTGTRAGDPVELRALQRVMGERTTREPCLVGSVKTNIGHTEGASGVAGLIKATLAIHHRTIPRSLHLQEPTPHFDWQGACLRVASEPLPWPSDVARAGVSSFGISGTDVHMLLEQAPACAEVERSAKGDERAELLVLSGASSEALRAVATSYREWLGDPDASAPSLGDIAYTAAVGRRHHDERLSVVAGDRSGVVEALAAYLEGDTHPGLSTGHAVDEAQAPVFVFSGQGSQWDGMARQLLAREPVFRAAIEACDEALRPHAAWSLVEVLTDTKCTWAERPIDVIQPTIFAVQVALTALWRALGVEPGVVVGHSMGEVAAAHVAGVLSLDDAARLICLRSQNLQAIAGVGGMLSVELSLTEASEVVARYEGRVGVAASNSPHATVLSGESAALAEIAETLRARSVFCRELLVDAAAHSPQLDPLLEEFARALRSISPKGEETLPLCSTVTGDFLPAESLDGAYWVQNQRQPVLFAAAVERLVARGHTRFVEIAPHPILLGPIRQSLDSAGVQGFCLGSLRRDTPDREAILRSVGELHCQGYPVRLRAAFDAGSRFVALPAYPFQRERFEAWPGMLRENAHGASGGAGQPDALTLSAGVQSPLHPRTHVWRQRLSLTASAYLRDHQVAGEVVLPGAAYVDLALQAAAQVFGDDAFELGDVVFETALVLDEQRDEDIWVALDLDPSDHATLRFYTRPAGEEGSPDSFVLHARAAARRVGSTHASRPTLDLTAVAARCAEADPQDHFAHAARRGVVFGPAFRGMHSLRLSQHEALAHLELPQSVPFVPGVHTVHAVLLDACWQAFAACLFAHNGDALYLPASIGRVAFHGALGTATVAHVALGEASEDDRVVADVRLYDANGALVGETTELSLRRVAAPEERPDRGLYAMRWVADEAIAAESPPRLDDQTWLVLADRGGRAEAFVALLQERGATCRVAWAQALDGSGGSGAQQQLDPADPAAMARLVLDAASDAQRPLVGAVSLWPLDSHDTAALDLPRLQHAQALGALATTHLVQALSEASVERPELWLVTREAQALDVGARVSAAQAPVWALARVLRYEFPEYRIHTVDLGPEAAQETELRALAALPGSASAEHQLALRGERMSVLRLLRDPDEGPGLRVEPARGSVPSFALDSRGAGVIDHLVLRATERRAVGAGQVEIEVSAAALNFIDVMKSLGVYPGMGDGPLLLGGECAGTITAVGDGVRDLHVGQRVTVIGEGTRGTFARYYVAEAALTAPLPDAMSFEEGATIPAVFLTAEYGLRYLARLARGERVLIHSAAGGVGMAAIQIARAQGAEIFATAGSEEKRALLRELGVAHVFDSRTLDFAEEILAATDGEGVDVVLNSLSGEAIPRSLSLLRTYGRFIEIGKRDIYADMQLGLLPFQRGLTFAHVDMLRLSHDRPDLIGGLLRDLMERFDRRELLPIRHRVTPAVAAADAFRTMAQAQHVGKLVLTGWQSEETAQAVVQTRGSREVRADGTYLITGGLGGLGLLVARSLAERGAGSLVLLGRSAPSPDAEREMQSLRDLGTSVRAVACDVSQAEQLESVLTDIASSPHPLRGVVHAAAVLDDGVALSLTPERYARVMGPKLLGAFHLHRQTVDLPLDFFVMFSSAAASLGSPGQGNYAAANEFLDALAEHRASIGLPALSVDWGPWRESGIAATAERAGRLDDRGMGSLSDREGIAALWHLLHTGRVRSVVLPGADFATWVQFYPTGAGRMLDAVVSASTESGGHSAGDEGVRAQLLAVAPAERAAHLESYVEEILRKVLRVPASKALSTDAPLNRFGVDSLMAVEIKNRMESDLGVVVPVSKILLSSGIGKLAADVLALLPLGSAEAGEPPASGTTNLQRWMQEAEDDELLDDLLEDDLEVVV